MKNKITKFATAAAALIILLALSQSIFQNTTATAYTLEQSIAAEKNIRSVHLRIEAFNEEIEPEEFWIEFDENGDLFRYRSQYGTDNFIGVKVYQDQTEKTRSRSRNEFKIRHAYGVNYSFKQFIAAFDPKSSVETAYNLEKEGKINIELNQLESGDIELKMTPLTDLQDLPRYWNYALNIMIIDPQTKLVKQRDLFYSNQDNTLVHKSRFQYFQYNQTFDPDLFDLQPPDGADIVDLTQNIGIPQGDLTDSQAAAEIVKQLIEARIARDFEKEAQLTNSATIQLIQSYHARVNLKFIRFIATGEPVPNPEYGPRAYSVPYVYEYERKSDGFRGLSQYNGKNLPADTPISSLDLKNFRSATVAPIPNRPGHWIIISGF